MRMRLRKLWLRSRVRHIEEASGETMVRKVDESYWNDYFRTHNEERFDDLVNRFFTEDLVFDNPKTRANGRQELILFLQRTSENVHIDLIPRTIIINAGVTAVELDCVMHARKDMPDFLLGPLKKGDTASMRMAGVYHLTEDRISRASVYWGRRE
jgi:limonene-1,2-epoxide hydrolase